MRTMLFSIFLLLSCKLYAADTDAGASSAAASEAGVPVVADAYKVIDGLARMYEAPYSYYPHGGTLPCQAVTWVDEDRIVAGVEKKIIMYDKRGKKLEESDDYSSAIVALASCSGRIAFGYGSRIRIEEIDREDGVNIKCDMQEEVKSIGMSRDGNIVIVGALGEYAEATNKNVNPVTIYDVRQNDPIKTYEMTDFITSVAVSPDGKKVAIGNGRQVDYGDIGTVLQVRTGSKDTKKEHSLVQAVCFTQAGGLYSGDNGGLLVCPMDEETFYYPTRTDGKAIDDQYRPWISALAHRAGGIWVLANDPFRSYTNQAPMVTRRKDGKNTYFDLKGHRLHACAANDRGDLVVGGSKVLLIENQE